MVEKLVSGHETPRKQRCSGSTGRCREYSSAIIGGSRLTREFRSASSFEDSHTAWSEKETLVPADGLTERFSFFLKKGDNSVSLKANQGPVRQRYSVEYSCVIARVFSLATYRQPASLTACGKAEL